MQRICNNEWLDKMVIEKDLLKIKEASEWASDYIKKNGINGTTQVSKQELINYYKSYNGHRELSWRDQLGGDLNWALSFDQYKEAETTKHVHRLHPYKGKFIPQLVEYFLDSHTDNFKKET